MKVSVEQKPNKEITLTSSVTAAAAGWTTVLTIPPGIHGRLRHFQLTASTTGACGWVQIRLYRGAAVVWDINDTTSNTSVLAKGVLHYDMNQDVEPGDTLRLSIFGTPSFSVKASCVATIFPTEGRRDPDVTPLPGRMTGPDPDPGRRDLVRLSALCARISLFHHDPGIFGRPPWKDYG